MPNAAAFQHAPRAFTPSTTAGGIANFLSRSFGTRDFDSDHKGDDAWMLRAANCGELTLNYVATQSRIRISGINLTKLLFTFNAIGQAGYRAGQEISNTEAGAGLIMLTPSGTANTRFMRTPGAGNSIAVSPASLLAVARAMAGPVGVSLLQRRLNHPLATIRFQSGESGIYARSVINSLHLVSDLLQPGQALQSVLCLDDLIQRQLVLMLCPELALGELPGQSQDSPRRFELLLEWLQAHRHEAISLSAMEERSGYSRRTLQKQFQKRFGCGPMQWLRRSRLELALEQLQDPQPGDSVTAIARRCGYLNLACFSRDFAAAYSKRPSELLRLHQGRY